jgi:hypothetical protein
MNELIRALPFLLGGVLGVGGVLIWGLTKARRSRRRFWSHGKGQLLRPPGYTLSQRHSDHWEKLFWPIGALFIGGGLVGAFTWAVLYAAWVIGTSAPIREQFHREGWTALTSATGFWPSLISIGLAEIGGLAAVVWGRFKFLDWMRDEYRIRTGMRGEQAVAEEMQVAVRAGYYLFNDVPTNADGNIDHVVVGPAGVFVLETKARSKPANAEGRDLVAELDGERISFTGGAYDQKAAKQAEALAKWLSKELSRSIGRTIAVKPVVVVPGWFVPRNNSANVILRNPGYFAKELRDANLAITDADIEAVAQQMEKLCRDVAL